MDARALIIKAREIAEMQGKRRIHFLNPNADRIRKSLGDAVGLSQIGVHLVEVAPGRDSTEHHRHYHEEECIYVLSGQGTLFIGDEAFPFGEGDFVGFPSDAPAHSVKNTGSEPLVCLVMGQRLAQDVADYPRRGKRLYRDNGRWDLVNLEDITDPRAKD